MRAEVEQESGEEDENDMAESQFEEVDDATNRDDGDNKDNEGYWERNIDPQLLRL